jgi:hypothetical protein
MSNLNSMAKESLSIQLLRDLEESRGLDLKVAGRRSGFNGVAVFHGDIVRKIEVKTVDRSDNWFAINGVHGIESLFFDSRYFLYFVLIYERKILIAPGAPFLRVQIPRYSTDVSDDTKAWLDLTKELSTKSGLNIIPRINFKLRVGIRDLISRLESGEEENDWIGCVDSIWHSDKDHLWDKTFPVSKQ